MNKNNQKNARLRDLFDQFSQRWNYPPSTKKPKLKFRFCGKDPMYDHKREPVYTPCWEHPRSEHYDQIRFGPCWDYSPSKFKKNPKVKICRGDEKLYKSLDPNFDNFKTLYTKWDYALEQCVHEQILKVETEFSLIKVTLFEEVVVQADLAENLRVYSIRYFILMGGSGCMKPYPEYISESAEQRQLCEFQMTFNKLNQSNCKLVDSIIQIKESMDELQARVNKLDMTLESPFLRGNGYGEPPLALVIEMLNDLYKYFHTVICKIKSWAENIDPSNVHSIEDYAALLMAVYNYKQIARVGIERCTCKRRFTQENALEPYLPCWAQKDEYYDSTEKPLPKYLCDAEIMAKPEEASMECPEEAESVLQSTDSLDRHDDIVH